MLKPVCVILTSLALLACTNDQAPASDSIPEVGVVTVQTRDIPYSLEFVAQTESSRQVDIVARVSGFLEKIAYREGEMVKEGKLLFELDRKPFQAQLEAARGVLQAQQARLTTAEANLQRVRPLAQENALSQADLDRAQGEYDAAKAAVYAAQATVTQADLNLGYATIRSPVTGLASRAVQREGAYLNAASADATMTYVAAIDPIWVNFSVSQNMAAKLSRQIASEEIITPKNLAFEVEIVMSDGTSYPYKGKISFADPSFSADTGSFQVRAVLPNPEHVLRPGMFVTAFLRGALRPDAVVVPQLAVQMGAKGHLVYVVNESGTAELRPVVVGDFYGDKEIVILSGLASGDRVVVDGVLGVVPGQPVKLVQSGVSAPDRDTARK
ncbi:MAG: efflux RND transporter periplasmic adaptor subunit [Gammaproteobacteria bacterium]|nr:efflux RND transporter periplasmic adaptor subunit [Gammaproteobacteria bacterium]